jgi:two-component system LytT family response regulator
MNKATFIRTKSNKTYPVDFSLDKLSDMLNPKHFFRVNRAYIVHLESIANMNLMGTRSIKLTLYPPSDDMVLVSNSRYSEFKEWLNL